MSYDVSFKAKIEGIDNYVPVGHCEANITWNVRDIITKSTGLEWKNEANNGFCKDVMPKIAAGIERLMLSGDEYAAFESKNGWGTINGVIGFFNTIIAAWVELKKYEPEIAEVATFWIE